MKKQTTFLNLSKRQLKQLRKEIVLNSIYIKDYDNSFNFNKNFICDFFGGYCEELNTIYNADNKRDFFDIVRKHDNIKNLYNYYCDVVACWGAY